MVRTSPQDVGDLAFRLVIDQGDLVARLSRGIALNVDGGVRTLVRAKCGAPPGAAFAVGETPSGPWLIVGPTGDVHVERGQPADLATVSGEAIASDPMLAEAIRRAEGSELVTSEANRILQPLFQTSALISREQFAAVRTWAPLLDQAAYRCMTRVSEFVDALRPTVVRELSAGVVESPSIGVYWWAIHVMGRLILLAADPGSRPWLVDMSRSFTWRTWTPTFVLLRERTGWLGAAAARSVAAFGEDVVDGYVDALNRSTSPMRAYDALFGLTTIGLSRKGLAEAMAARLRSNMPTHLARLDAFRDVVGLSYANALDVLSEDPSGTLARRPPPELKWNGGSPEGLATKAALLADPTSISPSGTMSGLTMLPFVVGTRLEEHFPRARTLRAMSLPRAKTQSDVIRRTWLEDQSPRPELLH